MISRFNFFRISSVTGITELTQRDLEYFARIIGQQQALFIFWFPQIGPTGHRFWVDSITVYANGCRAPDIGNGVVVIRVKRLVEHFRIEVFEIAQFAFIDLLDHAFFTHFRHKVS
ncbi:hypothetical protein D3C75_860150 [compost metagenome]